MTTRVVLRREKGRKGEKGEGGRGKGEGGLKKNPKEMSYFLSSTHLDRST